MRIRAVVILLILCLCCISYLPAKTSVSKVSLTAVLEKISSEYNVRISFSPSLTGKVFPKNTQTSSNVGDALTSALKGTGFTFKKMMGNIFYVYKSEKKDVPKIVAEPVPIKEPKRDTISAFSIVKPTTDTLKLTHKSSMPLPDLTVIPTLPKIDFASEVQQNKPFLPILSVKSNLLYDATTSMNLGVEIGLAPRWTLDISGNYNPWTFSDNRKMKHWLIQPEIRYWLCQRFSGHFFGLHVHYAQFNFGGMLPWGFRNGKMFGTIENEAIMNYRYQGWLVGTGIGYGYHFVLGARWGLEAEIGVGYAYLEYDKYRCEKCGEKLGRETKHYFGPTKAAISLVFMIK